MRLAVYAVTILASAFLLFAVQPMAGKALLPQLGGVPGAWTACLLFFQAALLAGFMASLPVTFWHLWGFISPGLYAQERKAVIPFEPASGLVLA